MEQITPKNIDLLRGEFSEALAAVAEKHGLTIKFGNSSYDEFQVKLQLSVQVNGKAKDYSEKYSWLPKLGTEFSTNGKKWQVIGHNISRPKFDTLCREIGSGKEASFSSLLLRRAKLIA